MLEKPKIKGRKMDMSRLRISLSNAGETSETSGCEAMDGFGGKGESFSWNRGRKREFVFDWRDFGG